ncbi:MAG: TRAP transporter small permease subunit [Immundisolibacterales bacterium]|nr:TRAP transporter small permease subunit [Immundisolibacterales bacterium]
MPPATTAHAVTPDHLSRIFAGAVVCITVAFLFNFALTFVAGWPGVPALFSHLGLLGPDTPANPLDGSAAARGWIQLLLYVGPIAGVVVWVGRGRGRTLEADAAVWSALAAWIVRVGFWSVFLVGLADAIISFLRVEEFLPALVGKELTTKLGLSRFRGQYIHVPLIGAACVISLIARSLSVIWLALLIVLAEFLIVITRFIFSYEQAFMGDLVRFWYASLFLLASAYSLVEEGHVRVDLFYTRFGPIGKAWTNALGSMLLGIPLCWVILSMGLWSKGSSLASPLLSFEISQSGFGLYVKYLMAGCLIVFAASMAAQFASYFLQSVAVIRGERAPDKPSDSPAGVGAV